MLTKLGVNPTKKTFSYSLFEYLQQMNNNA